MISVVIPTHGQKYIDRTIESLFNQKGIKKSEYEVIIVENPEITVETKVIYDEYRSKMDISLYSCDLGSNNARNTGIHYAKYDILAITDDDCELKENWLTRIRSLHCVYPDVGCIGGGLFLTYTEKKPPWIKNNFESLLSEVKWKNPDGSNSPFNIDVVPRSHMVSANLTFKKSKATQIGLFPANIGYHGKGTFISNDELQFINRISKLGSPNKLYDPGLVAYHTIGPERMNIDYFIKRDYGQGYADGIMRMEEFPEETVEHYHSLIQSMALEFVQWDEIQWARECFKNEDTTREWIMNTIKCRTAKMLGVIHAIEGKEPCKNPL
jgi:glycosyltransferase involved in cell wall biosynthesis